jgi:hypothetical protein
MMSQEQHQWRKAALFVVGVVGTMAALVASGYILGRPPPPSDADIRNCALEMIENRDVPVGPEDKCAAYVKPISVQVRSRREHDDFLLSSFFIKVETTVQMKREIAKGKQWYPGIECILPYRSSHPEHHVFAVGDEAVVKQHLRLTNRWFWRSKQWRCDSETR